MKVIDALWSSTVTIHALLSGYGEAIAANMLH